MPFTIPRLILKSILVPNMDSVPFSSTDLPGTHGYWSFDHEHRQSWVRQVSDMPVDGCGQNSHTCG